MTKTQPLSSLVLLMKNGTTAEQNQEGRGFPTTRIETISDGSIDLKRVRFVELDGSDVERWRIQNGDILLSHINSVEHIGKSAIYCGIPEILIHGMNLMLLRPDRSLVIPEYLHFGLRSRKVREHIRKRCKRAINQASINQKELGVIELPVPSLEEQRRIVEILSHAEGIVRLRREAQKKAADIIPALFIDMFGDQATNPKNLPITELGRFLSFITSGSRGWAKYYAPEGARFIRSLDVRMNSISDENAVFVNVPPGAEADRTRVSVADVLLTITGSQIGRVAPVSGNLAGAFVSQHVAILRLEAGLSPKFLSMFLSLDAGGQREIARFQYGQTKPGLSLQQIRKFMVPVPSISLQNKFVDTLEQVQSVQSQQSAATKKAEAAFDALLAHSFM